MLSFYLLGNRRNPMIGGKRASKGLSAKCRIDILRVVSPLIHYILALPPDEQRKLLTELKWEKARAKRRYARKACFATAQFTASGSRFNGYITDISTAGTFIEVPGDLKRLTRKGPIVLTCNHPDTKTSVRLKGRIVRIGEKGVGVRFDNLLE